MCTKHGPKGLTLPLVKCTMQCQCSSTDDCTKMPEVTRIVSIQLHARTCLFSGRQHGHTLKEMAGKFSFEAVTSNIFYYCYGNIFCGNENRWSYRTAGYQLIYTRDYTSDKRTYIAEGSFNSAILTNIINLLTIKWIMFQRHTQALA